MAKVQKQNSGPTSTSQPDFFTNVARFDSRISALQSIISNSLPRTHLFTHLFLPFGSHSLYVLRHSIPIANSWLWRNDTLNGSHQYTSSDVIGGGGQGEFAPPPIFKENTTFIIRHYRNLGQSLPPGKNWNDGPVYVMSLDSWLVSIVLQMVKMMIAVVVVYALCWLPLHCITLIGDTHPVIWNYRHIQTIWIACHWLAMSNCCYNPIVYCWMNDNFRSRFRYALRCLPCFADQSNRSAFAVEHSTNQRSVVGIKSGIFPSMVGTQRRLVTDSNSTASPMSIRSGRVNNCSKHNLSPGGVNSRLIDHIQLSDVISSNKRCHSTAAAVNLWRSVTCSHLFKGFKLTRSQPN